MSTILFLDSNAEPSAVPEPIIELIQKLQKRHFTFDEFASVVASDMIRPPGFKQRPAAQLRTLWSLVLVNPQRAISDYEIARRCEFIIKIDSEGIAWIETGPAELRFEPSRGWDVPIGPAEYFDSLLDLIARLVD